MSIPNIPLFEEFFTNLSIVKPLDANGYESAMAIEAQEGIDYRGHTNDFPEVRLWYKVSGDFTLDSMVNKIRSELQKSGHVSANSTILPLLSVYSDIHQRTGTAVERLNAILSAIIDAELIKVFVFPISPPEYLDFRFGSFKIGPLDARNISQVAHMADSVRLSSTCMTNVVGTFIEESMSRNLI